MIRPSPPWRHRRQGEMTLADGEAFGSGVRLVIPSSFPLDPATNAVGEVVQAVELAANRFEPTSELSRLNRQSRGVPIALGECLAELLAMAVTAAGWTGGLVDPTVGAAMVALGYDRDINEVRRMVHRDSGEPGPTPGIGAVRLMRRLVTLEPGVALDLGAIAKAAAAQWSAEAVVRAGSPWALVGFGGDIATAIGGDGPRDGWDVRVTDDHSKPDGEGQTIRIRAGAIATSSITCRTWTRAGKATSHIVDPRSGHSVVGPWRTVTVAAPSCPDANAAATAAIIMGQEAPRWLGRHGLAARLVGLDGAVVAVGGWPAPSSQRVTSDAPGGTVLVGSALGGATW